MTANQIRQKFLEFFKSKNHQIIPPAPLIPPDDPTTLFTSSGMQPLVPYLLGETHPKGKRLTDSQPSIRVQDIEEVGDNRHTTFFEMLGNWSLGDYFKKEQLPWIWEFLTEKLHLPKEKLFVSISAGGKGIPKDKESYLIWKKIGLPEKKIFSYPVTQENWWSRSGLPHQMPPGEIGGPDSEVFFEFNQIKHKSKFGNKCHPNCDCGRFLEIGNSVFIQYIKRKDGGFNELPQKNIDFGGGLERIAAAVANTPDVFQTDLFSPLVKVIETYSAQKYSSHAPSMRRIADHIKGTVMLASEGLTPSNKEQGSVMRRLIRRSLVSLKQLDVDFSDTKLITSLVTAVANIYQKPYPQVKRQKKHITAVITKEANQFSGILKAGIKKLKSLNQVDGKVAFDLYQSFGLPLEITQELLSQMGKSIDSKRFKQEFARHQQVSRAGVKRKFKGGLADQSETTVKLHTATHLLHQALRQILGSHVQQAGSNITSERLRFDFKHHQKMTSAEIKKVETLINQKIKQNLPVTKTIEDKNQALKSGALAFFKEKYPDKVSVYTIGKNPSTDWFSRELCGGPHVSSTAKIGPVRIKKEESIGGGIRRIYAVLDKHK